MILEETEELFSQLSEAGYEPRICENDIPTFLNPVHCGPATEIGDVSRRDDEWYSRDLFCDLVCCVLPDHEHLPQEAELRRMAVDCFSKPFKTWSDERAPVHGQHYLGYYDAGAAMLKKLPSNSQRLP